jgi:hypothetical protein
MITLLLKNGERVQLPDGENIMYKLRYHDLGCFAFTPAVNLKAGVIAAIPPKGYNLYTIVEIILDSR